MTSVMSRLRKLQGQHRWFGSVFELILVLMALAVTLGLLWVALFLLPPRLVDDPELSAKERADAQNGVRTVGVAALVAIGGVTTVLYTVRTFRLTQQSQLTERYTKAVAQLGEDQVEGRIGGIYALERLMQDSPSDQPTIVEVLAAYVRRPPCSEPKAEGLIEPGPNKGKRPTPGVHAALIVLSRRTPHSQERRLDLRHSDLRDAELGKGPGMPAGAQLREVNLTGAQLQYIELYDAQLQDADFYVALLNGANLERAQLQRAHLVGAELEVANLRNANLAGARLGLGALTPEQLAAAHGVEQIRWFRKLQDGHYEEVSRSDPQHPNTIAV
jgi:hypothetical protein